MAKYQNTLMEDVYGDGTQPLSEWDRHLYEIRALEWIRQTPIRKNISDSSNRGVTYLNIVQVMTLYYGFDDGERKNYALINGYFAHHSGWASQKLYSGIRSLASKPARKHLDQHVSKADLIGMRVKENHRIMAEHTYKMKQKMAAEAEQKRRDALNLFWKKRDELLWSDAQRAVGLRGD